MLRMNLIKGVVAVWSFLVVFSVGAGVVSAQELHQDLQETVSARVLEIVNEFEREIIGTNTTATVQELRIELLGGAKEGEVVILENDIMELKVGDRIFINRLELIDGSEYFTFKDYERRTQLVVVTALLFVLVLVFAGWQGARALFSLTLSIFAIVFVLVPLLLRGYSPALVSLAISAVILSVILFLTHGFKPRVFIAFFGTMSAVLVSCLLAWWSVSWMRLTGFGQDASVYLNLATSGALDMTGILLGSIIIGLLGVLDDVSITQASVVQELRGANKKLGFVELYQRAIRVGRDHVGSLVNTLALAYVGASLPIVLYFARSGSDIFITLNQEMIAAEIVRIVIGSIGLILAVPFTTALAAWYFKDKDIDLSQVDPVSCGHAHNHGFSVAAEHSHDGQHGHSH